MMVVMYASGCCGDECQCWVLGDLGSSLNGRFKPEEILILEELKKEI